MTVSIDVSPLNDGNAARGVGFYTKHLTEELQKLNDGHKYILCKNKAEVQNTSPDVIHYPFFDLFFPTLPNISGTPTVVTIHDVIPLVLAKMFPSGIKGKIILFNQKQRVKKATKIITDSECSKKDINKYLGIPLEKIEVVYLACDPNLHPISDSDTISAVKEKYKLPNQYFLKVGDINIHKNFHTLFDAMTRVPDMQLVLVGKAVAPDAPKIHELIEIEQWIKNYNLSSRIHRLGFIPSEDMSALYSGAIATIQNSLYEGFGLTALESMTCGTPVIAGNNSSQIEVVSKSGILIDAEDVNETSNAILKLLKMNEFEYKVLQEKAIEQAKKFTVIKMAKETREIYESVARTD